MRNYVNHTFDMLIKFRHNGVKRFFEDPRYTDKRGVGSTIAPRLIVILDSLDVIDKSE